MSDTETGRGRRRSCRFLRFPYLSERDVTSESKKKRKVGVAVDSSDDEAEFGLSKQSLESVVKVYCVHTEPNYSLPWQMKRQQSSTSSGFVVDGHRILTNAHSVENHTQVEVI